MCKCLCGHVFSVTLGVYLRVELLDCVETVPLLEEHPQRLHHFPFPPALVRPPVSLPPRQHLLLSIFHVRAMLVGVKLSAVVWACVSLMTNDAKQLVLSVMASALSTLVNVCRNLSLFLIGLLAFLLLGCYSYTLFAQHTFMPGTRS